MGGVRVCVCVYQYWHKNGNLSKTVCSNNKILHATVAAFVVTSPRFKNRLTQTQEIQQIATWKKDSKNIGFYQNSRGKVARENSS